MLRLDDLIIDTRIFETKFSCDVVKCKGACCTLEGTHGAPVTKNEIKIIKKIYRIILKYIPRKNIKVLDREGIYYRNEEEYSLNTVNDDECVFSYKENGIAKCSFQTAYYNNEIDFIKPLSCHLFPIRISGINNEEIKYEKLYECDPALDKGIKENITIFEFAEEPLKRAFGSELVEEMKIKFNNND